MRGKLIRDEWWDESPLRLLGMGVVIAAMGFPATSISADDGRCVSTKRVQGWALRSGPALDFTPHIAYFWTYLTMKI
jgi:hypothetical protein